MAITVRAQLRSVFKAVFVGGGDYGAGPGVSAENDDRIIDTGTGSYQADRVAKMADESLAGSANVDVDLSALLGPDGASIAAVECVWLELSAGVANAAAIQIIPSASNGWTALLSSSGATDDARLTLSPGAKIRLYAPIDGGYVFTGSDKSINLLNLGGSAVTYSITMLGRSA
jgi:hypothetical protein